MGDERGVSFIRESRRRLLQQFPDQVRACLEVLSDEDLWWRPNPEANSIGNLVLHLCGGTRHFIGRGIGGGSYVRDRAAEFAEKGPVPRAELAALLETTMAETAAALDGLTPALLPAVVTALREPETVQDLLSRISHHWAYHAGQIVYATKLRRPGALKELWEATQRP